MTSTLKQVLMVGPVALGALLAASGDAVANDFESNRDLLQQLESYSAEGNGALGQNFPGASQFSDVSPSDWAFQALDELVTRYDCLAGYPDGSYRGNRSLSRYEFAAGLNACLQQIERLIAETTADFVTREDLEVLRRLLQEFEAELAILGTRVDNLEGRVAFLEDNQFSTTTKLQGEVIGEFNGVLVDDKAYTLPFNDTYYNAFVNDVFETVNGNGPLTDAFAGQQLAEFLNGTNFGTGLFESVGIGNNAENPGALLTNLLANDIAPDPNIAVDGDFRRNLARNIFALQTGQDPADDVTTGSREADTEIVFGYRARLNFDTSFFGTDRLRVRLNSGNMNSLTFANLGTTQADRSSGDDTGNNVELSDLRYRFQLTDNIRAHVIPAGASIDDILDSGTTAPYSGDNLANANSYNTLFYDTAADDQAFGFNVALNDSLGFDIAYLAEDGENADEGLFGGSFTVPVQVNFGLSDRLQFALGYSYSYLDGDDSRGDDTSSWLGQNPFLYVNTEGNIVTDVPQSTSVYALNASWDVLDWMNVSGYVSYSSAVAEAGPRFGDNATYTAWGLNFAFPDLVKEGDVVVAGFAQLPKVTVDNGPDDPDASYIGSLEYRFSLTENIELAPGAYAILNPNGNAANDTVFVGMFRTTLSF